MKVLQGCTGKLALPSAAVARDRAKRMRHGHRGVVEAYHCRHCGAWHIGGVEERGQIFTGRQFKRRKAAAREVTA